ncbi:hypothetical protein BJ322DRAFT_1108619 [Thelephora terrestris]|uniref:Novel STAND NTPase 1 domain-containing protein n=1 Tax=Thelephora terrestris TaxID=56493 RepID=A0A9P6L6T2_9AGAM|nr:hypothetical protein BJ322DRAFT_1108619 [Thelephora terrestris]
MSSVVSKSQRLKRRDDVLAGLGVAIQLLSVAKDACGIAPAQIALGSACALLTIIRDTMGNKQDFLDLGLTCANVCKALNRGLNGKRPDEFSESVREAIEQLTTTIAEIREKVDEKGKQKWILRFINAKDDKDVIAAWRQDLDRVLRVFNTQLAINTHVMVAGIYQEVIHGGAPGQYRSIQVSVSSGELPPPALKAFFGRDGLVEDIVGRAENLDSIALIGAGGIGKTSIALAVLHHDLVKKRFGDNRRFVPCDQFPASRANFLARLSKVIGAGVENPEDLAPLRPLLSSKDLFIILDNAESILDPQGTDAQEIYSMVKELSNTTNIFLCITSRISTIPQPCKRLEIPTLTIEAACDVFYSIYGDGERSGVVVDLLRRLDFHALSITLLATTASDNKWDCSRLAEEWNERHVQVLRTDHNESLAATIELSLASPTFCKLGPNARDLLGVVAFFPQGIDEKNFERFFPAIPDTKNIFDKFCVLSLTHRSNGFVTMLAPIRDYLCPQDPKSSPLLCEAKDCYFAWLSIDLYPGQPGFGEAEWIRSEDGNVEHLLDVFVSINTNTFDAWDPCMKFMDHLYWHKPRQTLLSLKIEGLPDDHPSKPGCLFGLSQLSGSVGNYAEQKGLLTHALTLEREGGSDSRVAQVLRALSGVNLMLGLHEEGIEHAEEGLEIFERLGDTVGRARCLHNLAFLFFYDGQPEAAENIALQPIDFLPEQGQDHLLCRSHRVLGVIYDSKGQDQEAIDHLQTALRIATPFSWRGELFSIHYALAQLFRTRHNFSSANTHIEQAKLHTVNDRYNLGRAMEMQARIWYREYMLEEARAEALSGVEIYEKLGAMGDARDCRKLLQKIEQAMENWSISSESDLGDRRPIIMACTAAVPVGHQLWLWILYGLGAIALVFWGMNP